MTSHGIVIHEPPAGSPILARKSTEEDEALTTERTSKSNQKLALMSVRSRNAVSRRDDETDEWGVNDLNAKLEWKLMISDPELKSTVLTRLNTLRQNRELCDVAIFVREREIVAHKVVLASLSPVLLDKFLNDATTESIATPTIIIEPSNNITSSSTTTTTSTSGVPVPNTTTAGLPFYELNYVDYESFVSLVNYAYTGKLYISNRKVADLYKTTYELEIFPVANACARYLAEHLSVQSCIGIRRHANFNKDVFLVDQVDKFIAENIDAVITDSTEFSALPCIKTRVILPTGDLQKPDIGEEVCERVLEYFSNLTWTADRNDLQIESMAEKKHLLYIDASTGGLQDCVQLDAASQVGACEMVRDYVRNDGTKKCGHNKQPLGAEKVEHHINGAIRLNAVAKNDGKYASNESLESVETGPSDTQDEIETKLIVASETSKYFWVSIVVLFRRLVTISLQLTEDDEIIRVQVRAATEANGASAITESNESPSPAASTASSEGIDIKQVTDVAVQPASLIARLMSHTRANRVPLPSMGIARCSIGAVFVDGKIIICGGYDRGECLKSVEEYDVTKGNWSSLPDMFYERGRFDASVANNKVYAVAGSSGNRDLNTAECYDPRERKWMKIGNLHIPRSHNACTSLEKTIYCIGGSSDGKVLRECERYNLGTNEWNLVPSMQVARYQAAAATWRGLVIAIGGSDNWTVLDSVEAYDPKTDTWRFLAKLKTPRRGCAVAVVRDSLYVIGGHDGNSSLASVEILDSPTGNWRFGPSLLTPRANTHAVVTAGNVIYAIGGYNANQFLSSIELLECESVGWRNWQQESTIHEDEESVNDEGIPENLVQPAVAVL